MGPLLPRSHVGEKYCCSLSRRRSRPAARSRRADTRQSTANERSRIRPRDGTSASSRPVEPFVGTLRTHPLLNLLSWPACRRPGPCPLSAFHPAPFFGRNRLTQQSVVAHDSDPPDAQPANVTE